MSTETLNVEVRPNVGKIANKHLRREGKIPATLYGHGEASLSISVNAEAFGLAMRHHSRLVQLQGGVNESALIKALQYNTFGTEILHVDFTRVSTDERIEVDVSVELKGTSLGAKSGGVIAHILHEVQIECLATAIPEKLTINVTNLDKGGELFVKNIDVPEGVKILTEADSIVVQCVEPGAEPETPIGGGAAEPEIIGRKAGEEAAAEEKK
jgi:large subunit ribosomal protein L25